MTLPRPTLRPDYDTEIYCSKCKEAYPRSLEKTNCPVCGRTFRRRSRKFRAPNIKGEVEVSALYFGTEREDKDIQTQDVEVVKR